MLRTPVKMVAAALAAGAVLTACGGPVKMGAATVMNNGRISASTLSAEVANLNANYQKYKSQVQLQYEVPQMPQEVLSWLIRFQVGDEMAVRNGISVTPGQIDAEQQKLQQQASQSTTSGAPVPLNALAVANGLPPDMIPDLARYQVIQNVLINRLDGGKIPTAQSDQQALGKQLSLYQCRAAKSLDIRVNPQWGQLDYAQYSVIAKPSTLSAAASPSPSPSLSSSVQLTPPC